MHRTGHAVAREYLNFIKILIIMIYYSCIIIPFRFFIADRVALVAPPTYAHHYYPYCYYPHHGVGGAGGGGGGIGGGHHGGGHQQSIYSRCPPGKIQQRLQLVFHFPTPNHAKTSKVNTCTLTWKSN